MIKVENNKFEIVKESIMNAKTIRRMVDRELDIHAIPKYHSLMGQSREPVTAGAVEAGAT